ncbi:MAG: hypothetical protein WCZ65_10600 [Lysobacteraceae bacterium]|jgi:hypothetical protein
MRLVSLLLLSAVVQPVWAVSCDAPAAPLPVRNTVLAPFATEVPGLPGRLGASSGLLAGERDETLSVDMVLLRLGREACLAKLDADVGGQSGDAFAGYQKKTEHDNTPWRYESKPGQRFSAQEFDAWMKSRGVRVAKGRSEATTAAQTVGE